MMNRKQSSTVYRAIAVALVGFVLAQIVLPNPLVAQAALSGAREMRHFWHVFIAYAIAWILVFGWLLSILRRLRRVEEKLRS
jgi:CcmD family protein